MVRRIVIATWLTLFGTSAGSQTGETTVDFTGGISGGIRSSRLDDGVKLTAAILAARALAPQSQVSVVGAVVASLHRRVWQEDFVTAPVPPGAPAPRCEDVSGFTSIGVLIGATNPGDQKSGARLLAGPALYSASCHRGVTGIVRLDGAHQLNAVFSFLFWTQGEWVPATVSARRSVISAGLGLRFF